MEAVPAAGNHLQQKLPPRKKSNDDEKRGEKGKKNSGKNSNKGLKNQQKRIAFSADVHSDDNHELSGKKEKARRESVNPTEPALSRPDWYADLEDKQIDMFKEVFEMLDQDGGGTIEGNELYSIMKDMDIDISLQEIKQVLGDLDKDGNGEIDFDEFLYAMCANDSDGITDDNQGRSDGGRYSKRQTLFFSAITRFAIKNSLGEIDRYYNTKMRQAPHVISYYTAGVRLIGLNDRQLEQEMKRLTEAGKNSNSPYAKPLPFVTPKAKRYKKPAKRSRKGARPKVAVLPPKHNAPIKDDEKQTTIALDSSPSQTSQTLIDTMMLNKLSESLEEETLDNKNSPGTLPGRSSEMLEKLAGSVKLSTDASCEDVFDEDKKIGPPKVQNRRQALTAEDIEILKVLKGLAEHGNILAKIPDIHMVPQIRNKLGFLCQVKRLALHNAHKDARMSFSYACLVRNNGTMGTLSGWTMQGGQMNPQTGRLQAGGLVEPLCSSVRKRRRTLNLTEIHDKLGMLERQRKLANRGRGTPRGWAIPRIERGQAPLPVIKLRRQRQGFTIEDVPDIRKRVTESMDVYYTTLKKAHVKTAYDHWDQLHTEQIRSKHLRERFSKVYRAYSPHEYEEVFAISPWIPGRCRFSRPRTSTGTAWEQNPPARQVPSSAPPCRPKSNPAGFQQAGGGGSRQRPPGSAPNGGARTLSRPHTRMLTPSPVPTTSSRPSNVTIAP